MSGSSEGPTPFLTALKDARAIIMSEIPGGGTMNEELFLKISGGDAIPFRRMFKDVDPDADTGRINAPILGFLNMSSAPEIKSSPQMNVRMKVLPAQCRFVTDARGPSRWNERKANPNMKSDLPKDKQAMFDFLMWAMQGAQKTYLPEYAVQPVLDLILRKSEEMKSQCDVVTQFMESELIFCSESAASGMENKVYASDMQKACSRWAAANNTAPRELYNRVSEILGKKTGHGKVHYFANVKLTNPEYEV